MEDPKLPSNDSSSIPLIARLDHLEFIMKYLERKQRCGSNAVVTANDKQSAEYFKGTLLERVASLENRLFQLCVEMDSSGSSNPLSRASTIASGESSSSQGSKGGEISYSFPTFNNVQNQNGDNEIMPQNHNNTYKEKAEIVQAHTKNSCSTNKQQQVVVAKNKGKKSEKKRKGEKKTVPPISWPHLKLLGC
ncbi:microspore-specific promoter [Trifolium repens]|nr:microspore-specific promoter [Trifolium repens]